MNFDTTDSVYAELNEQKERIFTKLGIAEVVRETGISSVVLLACMADPSDKISDEYGNRYWQTFFQTLRRMQPKRVA